MHSKAILGNLVVGLLLALMVLTGCSQKPEDAIVGTWQANQKREVIFTFTKDGNLYRGDQLQGEYWFEDDDTLSIRAIRSLDIRSLGSVQSFHFRFQKDTIILTPEEGGNMLQLTKIRD